MRHNSGSRRHRGGRGYGQNNNGGNGQNQRRGSNRAQVFDSNGPEVRIRGTAYQVVEKYLTLAKDAASAGDRILAESYSQHAEHYQRVISAWEEEDRQNGFTQPAYAPQAQSFSDQAPAATPVVQHARDDLSLPASIIGAVPKVESQTRVEETAV
jgi:hypothetical protein